VFLGWLPETTSSIELRVLRRADGDTWRDEVVVLVDDADALATFGQGRWQAWMGLHPGGAAGRFGFPKAGVFGDPDGGARSDRFVARCDCGELGCGALVARVTRSGDKVVWDQFRHGSDARAERKKIVADPIEFEVDRYEAALRGSTTASSWQPTTRRAALQAMGLLDAVDLTPLRLRSAGFRSRGDDEVVARLVLGQKADEDYGFLSFGTTAIPGESAEELAQRVTARVTTGAVLTDESVERERLTRGSPTVNPSIPTPGTDPCSKAPDLRSW
jgi:hypothetical protein